MAELTHTSFKYIAHSLKLPMLTHVGVTHTYTNPKSVCVGVCECVMVISFPLHIYLSVNQIISNKANYKFSSPTVYPFIKRKY